MKLDSSDIINILRLFKVADAGDVARQVKRINFGNPSAINLLLDFRFRDHDYVVLVDDTAEDNTDYILKQIAIALPGRTGRLLENPNDDIITYGVPYEGKDVYLYSLEDTKQRLDVYLAQEYPDLSRSSWQKHIKAGRVCVNSSPETSPKALVDHGDTIQVKLPDDPDHSSRQLDIVYIDDDVIVIDKPVGVLTHPKSEVDTEFTVADFFDRYMTKPTNGLRPGVVHRLDRDTSGLMIGARNEAAFDHLKDQFTSRQVSKTYVAITDGVPSSPQAHIDLPIARNRSRPGSFTVNQQGKSAQTDYSVLFTHNNKACIELRPLTGRTHQLRVHLNHLGTPIHGDRLYGKSSDRLYLHAHKLSLRLPSGEEAEFISPIPPEFSKLVPAGRDG